MELRAGTLTLRPGTTKANRGAGLPLPGWVAEVLRPLLRRSLPTRPLFPGPWRSAPGRMLDRDLEAAGIPKWTDAGLVDFHALRTTAATLMAAQGVPLAHAAKILRHSSPTVTARH